jgi:hypothetical protein
MGGAGGVTGGAGGVTGGAGGVTGARGEVTGAGRATFASEVCASRPGPSIVGLPSRSAGSTRAGADAAGGGGGARAGSFAARPSRGASYAESSTTRTEPEAASGAPSPLGRATE